MQVVFAIAYHLFINSVKQNSCIQSIFYFIWTPSKQQVFVINNLIISFQINYFTYLILLLYVLMNLNRSYLKNLKWHEW